MIPFLITILLLTVFVRQFYGARVLRWQARGRALAPIGRHLVADIRAPLRDFYIELEARRMRRSMK